MNRIQSFILSIPLHFFSVFPCHCQVQDVPFTGVQRIEDPSPNREKILQRQVQLLSTSKNVIERRKAVSTIGELSPRYFINYGLSDSENKAISALINTLADKDSPCPPSCNLIAVQF